MPMNADELRRLSQQAADRKKQESLDAARKDAELQQRRKMMGIEHEWAKAREAVATLEAKVREAANKGERALHVYSFDSTDECPVTVTCVKRLFSYDQITKGCKDHRYSYQVPDYAQYVYENCSQLNPRWSPGCNNLPCCRGGSETYPNHSNYCYFFLYVSW